MIMQTFEDDDEEMEMPCPCEKCGRWFELNDGGAPGNSRIIIRPKCYERETEILELQEQIQVLEYDMENGEIKKRDGKKQVKELKAKIKKLES